MPANPRHDGSHTLSYPDPVSVSSATLTTTYNYDTSATGRLLSVTGPDVTLTYGYLGSIPVDVTWSGAISANLHRDLDTATVSGRAVSDLVTANETVTVGSSVLDVAFGYDADGVLASASAGGVLSMSRYPGTTLLHSVSDSIATETYTPNGFGETQDYGATVGSSTLISVHYNHDALGRITGKTEQITDGAGGLDVDSVTYGYDAAGAPLAGDARQRRHRVRLRCQWQPPAAAHRRGRRAGHVRRAGPAAHLWFVDVWLWSQRRGDLGTGREPPARRRHDDVHLRRPRQPPPGRPARRHDDRVPRRRAGELAWPLSEDFEQVSHLLFGSLVLRGNVFTTVFNEARRRDS